MINPTIYVDFFARHVTYFILRVLRIYVLESNSKTYEILKSVL